MEKYLFTKNQFIRHYINIGPNVSNLNRNNNYYILGSYYGMSIINSNKIFISLKKRINFLIRYSKKKNRLNFLLISINKNKILSNKYINKCTKIKCSYFNGTWWNGLLMNFKKYIKYNSKNTKRFKFFNNQYPNFCFYIDRQIKIESGGVYYNYINKEINQVSMLNVFFQNASFSHLINPSAILTSTQTYLNNIFLVYFSLKLIKKNLFIQKKKFIVYAFNKYKFNKIKKFNMFYEYIFFYYNKKNFLKEVLWSDDLK